MSWHPSTYTGRTSGAPALTVGQLRALLDDPHLADGTLVVLDDGAHWYVHVGQVGVPDPVTEDGCDPDGLSCVTLVPGEPYDPRDH